MPTAMLQGDRRKSSINTEPIPTSPLKRSLIKFLKGLRKIKKQAYKIQPAIIRGIIWELFISLIPVKTSANFVIIAVLSLQGFDFVDYAVN